MRFDVLTLFPEMFRGYLGQSLLNKAIERGLIDDAAADEMSSEQLQRLIFAAGFSTREIISLHAPVEILPIAEDSRLRVYEQLTNSDAVRLVL